MKQLPLLLASLFIFSSPAFADVAISDVRAFETAEGMKNGAVLLTIKNTGAEDDKLVSASSDIAARTEVHEMTEENGVMKMRKVEGITVKAGETVNLKPEGYHIMVMDLKAPLKTGEKFPLTLTFEKSGNVTKDVDVVSRMAAPVHHHSNTDQSSHDHH